MYFSDDEEDEKRVVRSLKDKRSVSDVFVSDARSMAYSRWEIKVVLSSPLPFHQTLACLGD